MRDDRERKHSGEETPSEKERYRRPPPRAEAPPLDHEELLSELEPREPLVEPHEVALELGSVLSSVATPRVELRDVTLPHVEDGRVLPDDKGRYEVEANLRLARLGDHRFGPSPQLRAVRFEQVDPVIGYPGHRPDHLPLRPVPRQLPKELEAKPRTHISLEDLGEDVIEPTTVFSPDDRYTFSDTAFPWCTVGRVDTPGGSSSGVMVGPRHILTVSHAIDWNDDGTAGWVKFTPSYFDGSEPFGVAWGAWVYWEGVKVDGSDGIAHPSETRHDYVVVVLQQRMGNLTGWMGSRRYSTDWDDEPYWRHIGYPGDLASGQRPSYERDIALDGQNETHMNALHRGDVWPGQSGGPFFAWWSGEDWPRVVCVQSGQTPSDNWASGGDHMVDLVVRARDDFP